jgi:hypothetical protein
MPEIGFVLPDEFSGFPLDRTLRFAEPTGPGSTPSGSRRRPGRTVF